MSCTLGRLLIAASSLAATSALASSQSCAIELRASNATGGDRFGSSVALFAEVAVVGAPETGSLGAGAGAAYVFRRGTGAWAEEAELFASDGAAGAAFGADVAVLGDTAVVGAPGAATAAGASGAVYVFQREGGAWTQRQKLVGADVSTSDGFGGSVTLGPGVLVVSAPEQALGRGAVYVFREAAGSWSEEAKLLGGDSFPGDRFGASLSLSGDGLAIGAPRDTNQNGLHAGAVYVFRDQGGGSWVEQQKLTAGDGEPEDFLGSDVGLAADTLIAGAEGDDDRGVDAGAAYSFEHSAGVWSEVQKLVGSDVAGGDAFGAAVALEGDAAVVGAGGVDAAGIDSGAAFLFAREGGIWVETRRTLAPDPAPLDGFGVDVSLEGAQALVGALEHEHAGQGGGAVYVLPVALSPLQVKLAPLYTIEGLSPGSAFGYSVSGGGDVDGDGLPDLIAGAYLDDPSGANSGSARVFSGSSGALLFTFHGDAAGDLFGRSVDMAGDVDQDGFVDLIVGAPWDDDNGSSSGSARVFSGVDGSVLYTFHGDAAGQRFGWSVSGAGDVDADGFADLVVGAYLDDAGGLGAGSARVLSGADGSVLYTFYGDAPDDHFGLAVGAAGDVDGDGYADLIVGAPNDDDNGSNSGSARILSGLDGSVLYTFFGDSAVDNFGFAVGGADDVNGDGFADLIVGARLDDDNGANSGSARVFSGADGSVLYTFLGDSEDDRFGYSVGGAGDVDGDGLADLIVGAKNAGNNGSHSGSARVFSGADGSVLQTLDGDAQDDFFGRSVSSAGDVDGDGLDEVVVGADGHDAAGLNAGSVRLFAATDCNGNGRSDACDIAAGASLDVNTNGVPDECEPIGGAYCSPANNNSSGLPAVIQAFGSVAAAENSVALLATQLPPERFGYFLASRDQGLTPFPGGSQGVLCLGGTIGRFVAQVFNSGPGGTGVIQVDSTQIPLTPTVPVMPGETWNFQGWYRDANPGNTSNFTDAVSVTFV